MFSTCDARSLSSSSESNVAVICTTRTCTAFWAVPFYLFMDSRWMDDESTLPVRFGSPIVAGHPLGCSPNTERKYCARCCGLSEDTR
jgi:hypothetical protein